MSEFVNRQPARASLRRLARATWAIGIAAIAMGLLAVAPGAAGASECLPADLTPEFPRYSRVGKNIAIQVSQRGSNEYSGTVEVTPAGSSQTFSYPLELRNTWETSPGNWESTVLVPAGRRSRETRVAIHWLERKPPLYEGGPAYECDSTAVGAIPVVPPGGRVGDPSIPRFIGRFRVSYRIISPGFSNSRGPGNVTWKLHPQCRYFGCFTKLRSNRGLRGTLSTPFRNGRRTYKFAWNGGPAGQCSGVWINELTGETVGHWKIRRAYYEFLDIFFDTVEETASHRVKSFSGRVIRHYEPILSAKRRGCIDTYTKERIRGRLIR